MRTSQDMKSVNREDAAQAPTPPKDNMDLLALLRSLTKERLGGGKNMRHDTVWLFLWSLVPQNISICTTQQTARRHVQQETTPKRKQDANEKRDGEQETGVSA